MNYTKGKWKVHPMHTTDVYALNNGSYCIAECANPFLPTGESEANAQLIASAPELYEALKEVKLVWRGLDEDISFPHLEETINKAIAKAERKEARQ